MIFDLFSVLHHELLNVLQSLKSRNVKPSQERTATWNENPQTFGEDLTRQIMWARRLVIVVPAFL